MVISDDTLENRQQYPPQYNHYHFQSAMQVPAVIQLKPFNIEQGKENKKDEGIGSALHILQPKSDNCLMFSELMKKGTAKSRHYQQCKE